MVSGRSSGTRRCSEGAPSDEHLRRRMAVNTGRIAERKQKGKRGPEGGEAHREDACQVWDEQAALGRMRHGDA
jgi:hypothetical protein